MVCVLSKVKLVNGSRTVNAKLADLPLPSTAVAVIVVVPAARHLTFPLLSTVATDVLLELQFTLLLFASLGETVAVILKVSPIFLVCALLGFILIPVTF